MAELAGEPIQTVLTQAPGKGAPIGGVKVIAKRLVRGAPVSDRSDLQDLCGEVKRADHLHRILDKAQTIVKAARSQAAQSRRL